MDEIIDEERGKVVSELRQEMEQLKLKLVQDEERNRLQIEKKTQQIEKLLEELAQKDGDISYLDVSIDQMSSTVKEK
jgi:predicted RNase H-like nuclease (RuvC/YqgF family)